MLHIIIGIACIAHRICIDWQGRLDLNREHSPYSRMDHLEDVVSNFVRAMSNWVQSNETQPRDPQLESRRGPSVIE